MLLISRRPGERPRTSSRGPHRQLSQNAAPQWWGRLVASTFALTGVEEGHSSVSLPSSRAVLIDNSVRSPASSLLAPREPVHIHGVFDGSVHLCLPLGRAAEVIGLGWGEPHVYADHDTEIMSTAPGTRAS